jgi:cytochrome P450
MATDSSTIATNPEITTTGVRLRRLDDLPGPRAWPLVGNLLDTRPERFHLQLEEWSRRYGPLVTYRLGTERALLVSDAALAQQVFRARPDTFRRMSRMANVIQELLGPNVFSAEGAEWRSLRRLVNEALSARYIRRLYPALSALGERLRVRWTRFAREDAAVDVQLELTRFAVDVTTRLTLGVDLDTLGERDDGLQSQLEQLFPAVLRRLTAPVPYWRWVRLPEDRRLDRALVALRERLEQLVDETRTGLEHKQAGTREPRSFIEAMLEARDADGEPYSSELIIGNLLTMLLAGEDTTANTIAWALHHLCDAPEVFEALKSEAARVLGDGRILASDADARELAVAGAVLAEALRVRPVVAWHSYETLVDTVLGGVVLPRGTAVQLVARPAIEREEGCDEPLRFEPLRRLQDEPRISEFPFGAGPRICPGRYLANLEGCLVLSMVARNFQIERVGDGSAVVERTRFTMVPEGIRIRFRTR